jgi:hypothetical protein
VAGCAAGVPIGVATASARSGVAAHRHSVRVGERCSREARRSNGPEGMDIGRVIRRLHAMGDRRAAREVYNPCRARGVEPGKSRTM